MQPISVSAKEVEYVLCIQGLSPGCRWQELKDITRRIPPDGHIRQAYTVCKNGTGWGHITILNKKKAFDAYGYFYEHGWQGHNIRLTLVAKDENNPEILRILRGPEDSPVGFCQRYQPFGVVLPPNTPITSDIITRTGRGVYSYGNAVLYTGLAAPLIMQPVTPEYIFYHLLVAQRLTPLSSPPSHNYKASRKRTVGKSSSSLCSKQGNHTSEEAGRRGRMVFLYNLPHFVGPQAVAEHLSSVAVVDECLVRKARRSSSKTRLTAVATFSTPQQAQTAIDRFNGTMWKGYEIKIRLDRGPTASGVSSVGRGKSLSDSRAASRARGNLRGTDDGPLVVNGSGNGVPSRQAWVDSDDESSCDEGTK